MKVGVLCCTVLAAATLVNARSARIPAVTPVSWPRTVELPETAWVGKRFVYRQFRVAPAASKDMQGESIHEIPAWKVAVEGGAGWNTTTPTPLPKFISDIPTAMREQIAIFLFPAGWFAAPKGWHVTSAVYGATPSWGATLTAPRGPSAGWLSFGGSGPGLIEVFSAAEGYFPGAYRLEDKIITGALTQDAELSPEPDSLTHLTPCTAAIAYRSGGLVVRGIKLFQPRVNSIDLSPYVRRFFIALPKDEMALQDYLVKTFREEHPIVDCQSKTW